MDIKIVQDLRRQIEILQTQVRAAREQASVAGSSPAQCFRLTGILQEALDNTLPPIFSILSKEERSLELEKKTDAELLLLAFKIGLENTKVGMHGTVHETLTYMLAYQARICLGSTGRAQLCTTILQAEGSALEEGRK